MFELGEVEEYRAQCRIALNCKSSLAMAGGMQPRPMGKYLIDNVQSCVKQHGCYPIEIVIAGTTQVG